MIFVFRYEQAMKVYDRMTDIRFMFLELLSKCSMLRCAASILQLPTTLPQDMILKFIFS